MRKLISILIMVAVLTMGLMVAAAPSAGASTLVDSVDFGTPASEATHNVVQNPPGDWGPIETTTHGGSYGQISIGGYPDFISIDKLCRTIWKYTTDDSDGPDATFTLVVPTGMKATGLGLRVLDGYSDDSFKVEVNGQQVFSYADAIASPETWLNHQIDISSWGFTGTLAVKITATAGKGSYFNPYGQVAVDRVVLFAEEAPPTPTPTIPPKRYGGGGGGCFIATAAYGSPLDSHLDTLRGFRDQYLETNPVGASLVSLYYKTSPPIAQFIDEHPTVKPVVRAALMPAVAMSKVALSTTLAQKIAILAGIALVSLALVVCLRRWAFKRG